MRTVIAGLLLPLMIGLVWTVLNTLLDLHFSKSYSFGYQFKLKKFLSNWGIAAGLVLFGALIIFWGATLIDWAAKCPGPSPCARP